MTESGLFTIGDGLIQSGLRCVIIGGHAVNHHGFNRSTEDLNPIFQRDDQSDRCLFETLTRYNAAWLSDEIDPQTRLEIARPVTLPWIAATRLMMLQTDVGFVDLFDFVPGLPETPVANLLDDMQLDNGRPSVSLPWRIQMKRASDRPRDRMDIERPRDRIDIERLTMLT